MTDNTTVLYLRGVPRHIRDYFKSYCARRGESMTKALIGFMTDTVKKDQQNKQELQWVRKGGT